MVETLLGFGAEVHVRGGKLRETPLHIAARVADGDRCALMLLKSGAGANKTTDDGQTPVHVAAKYGNVQTLDLLLEDNGDPLIKSNVRSLHEFVIYCLFMNCFCNLLGWRNTASLGRAKQPSGYRKALDRFCATETREGSAEELLELHERGRSDGVALRLSGD